AQVVEVELGADAISPRMLHERDAPDGPVPRFGAGQQLGAAVCRVRGVLGEPVLDEQIGDAPDPLAGHPHDSPDVGESSRLVQHAAQDLPPGRGDAAGRGHLLRGVHQPGIEPERRERDVGDRLARRCFRWRLRPLRARRNIVIRCGRLGGHAAPEAWTKAGYALGSPRWNTPSYASRTDSGASPSRLSVARANWTGESGPAVTRSPSTTA